MEVFQTPKDPGGIDGSIDGGVNLINFDEKEPAVSHSESALLGMPPGAKIF